MSEKPDQIQASVAAALSRLRGDLGPSGATAPNAEEQHGEERARPANDVRSDPFFGSVQSPPLGTGMVGSGHAPIPMTPFPRMQAPQDPAAMEPETPDEVAPESTSNIEIPDMPERAAGRDFVAMPEYDAAATEALRSAPEAVAAAAAAPQAQGPGGGNSPLSRMMRGSGAPGSGGPAQRDLLADLPPPPISEPLAADTESIAAHRRRRNRRLVALAAIIIVAAVGVWLWTGSEPSTEVPVITADATPEKVKPADEGGLQVQNQDVQVLDPSAQTQTETVMPEPEQPITPPTQTAPGENAGSEQAPIVVDGAANNSATTPPTGDAPPAPGVPLAETPLPAMEGSDTTTSADTQNTTDTAEPTTSEPAPAAPATSAPEPAQTAPNQAAEAPAAAEQAPAQSAAEAPSAPTPAPAAEPAQAAQPEAPATQAAPTQEAAVTPSAPTGNTRVQLAAGKSEAAVQKEWAALQKAHPQLLGDLRLMIERVDKGEAGIFYRLQAGPLADKKAAGQLCSSLKQQGRDCIVVAK